MKLLNEIIVGNQRGPTNLTRTNLMDYQDKSYGVIFCQPLSYTGPIIYYHSEHFISYHFDRPLSKTKGIKESLLEQIPRTSPWTVEMEILRYTQNDTSFVASRSNSL